MDGLHAIGTPWWAVIPAAAVVFRGVLMHYGSKVPSRRRQRIRQNLMPLTQANQRIDDLREAAIVDQEKTERNAFGKWARNIWRSVKTQHKTAVHYGGGLISVFPYMNFLTLLVVSESIRMKTGANSGILPTLLAIPNFFAGKAQGYDPLQYQAELMAQHVERVREERLQLAPAQGSEASGNENLSEFALNADAIESSHQLMNGQSIHFDPSMQTEGFAWATDLTVADPTYILPAAYFLTMLATVLATQGNALVRLRHASGLPLQQRLTQLVLSADGVKLIFAGVFSWVMSGWPAAIVLYLTSSSLINQLQRRWMDITMPLGPAITRCMRQTRVRARKEWSTRQ